MRREENLLVIGHFPFISFHLDSRWMEWLLLTSACGLPPTCLLLLVQRIPFIKEN